MADSPSLGLCSDCLYERHQRVEAVTLYAGVSVCATCNDSRQLGHRLTAMDPVHFDHEDADRLS